MEFTISTQTNTATLAQDGTLVATITADPDTAVAPTEGAMEIRDAIRRIDARYSCASPKVRADYVREHLRGLALDYPDRFGLGLADCYQPA